MEPLLRFTFKHSKSKDFSDIIRRCKHFSSFASSGKDYVLEISSVEELMTYWDDFSIIATRITDFVGSQAWFMGDQVIPFKNELFYKIQDSIDRCYKGQKNSSFKDSYCDSDWGCRWLDSIHKDIDLDNIWTFHRHWYRYGKFEGEKIWKVDKGAILHLLEEEAKVNYVTACPVFDIERVRKAVSELPDKIILDENWKILYRTELTQNGFKDIPYSIAPAQAEINEDHDLKSEIIQEEETFDFKNASNEEINRFLDNMKKGDI